jgi:hypothetical protein
MPLPLLPSSLPLLLPQPSLSLLPTPQLPNAIALSAAIAAIVAITHLFDTAIKWQWHGQWRQKRWLRQQGWRANNGNNGNVAGDKMRNGDGYDVAGDKEGNGKSGKSNDNGDNEGNVDGGKGNGDGIEEGKGNG